MDTLTEELDETEPIAIPSDRLWFDPMMLNVASQIVITNVVLVGGVVKQLAPQSVGRYMIGIVASGIGFTFQVGPWPDADQYGLSIITNPNVSFWGSLFNYGPIVSSSWYGYSAGGGNLRVVQILRN